LIEECSLFLSPRASGQKALARHATVEMNEQTTGSETITDEREETKSEH
jgi:hypothetical protein